MCHFQQQNKFLTGNHSFLRKEASNQFKMTGDKESRDKRQLTHHIHPACIPSSLREHDPSSPSLERGTDREKEAREGKREGNRWRDIEMDTERVFMHVCGHMYTSVRSIDAKKKKRDNGYHTIC